MIEKFEWSDRMLRPALFGSMHADRKRVFVDWLGWDVPHLDGQEVDAYDRDGAVYLVLPDPENGQHRASVRLLPTEGRHILADVFRHLCEGEVPRGPRIREITRMCVSPNCPPEERVHARRALAIALVHHARSAGLESYTAVTEVGFLSRVAAAGWRCRPLGLPVTHGGSRIGALIIDIDADSLDELRSAGTAVEDTLPLHARIAA